jgi:hypothetical protein
MAAVRFTTGDLSEPVDFPLVLGRTEDEQLCQDLQHLLRGTTASAAIEATWLGTWRKVYDWCPCAVLSTLAKGGVRGWPALMRRRW